MSQTEYDKIHGQICKTICKTVPRGRIGVAFSGGLDSSLVAKICHDMGYEITLMTVGFAGCHDIGFAKTVASAYGYKHEILEIGRKTFAGVVSEIESRMQGSNLSWIENAIAFYYMAMLAKSIKISTMVTANGIDELFCGYDAYRSAFENGHDAIGKMTAQKVCNERQMLVAIDGIVQKRGIRVIQPLLSEEFVSFAAGIPVHQKIKSADDLVRKHIIRALAIWCGVPRIAALKRKKAMQYGSGIHKEVMRIRKGHRQPG